MSTASLLLRDLHRHLLLRDHYSRLLLRDLYRRLLCSLFLQKKLFGKTASTQSDSDSNAGLDSEEAVRS